jgi:hypothetical protein
MSQRQKRSNDSNIAKTWSDVNKIFNTESPLQRQQRQAQEQLKRAERLKQQAREVMTENSGGSQGVRNPR